MKIATWNLERALPGTPKADRQQQWIDRINADIWVLTETHGGIAPGGNYRSISSGLPDRPAEEGERWVQIWVRDRDITPVPTADAARTACGLIALDSEHGCLIYGTILPWLDSDWRTYPAANGEAFTAALGVQQADWIQLQITHPNATLVVAGDFNQDLNVLPYYGSRRTKQALRQALLEANLECLTFGDNDPVRRLINSQHSNIDHICMPHRFGLQIQSTFAWPDSLEDLRGLSDHFGVGLEVNWSEISG
ncbi:MAG TPA: endonuclease/exonuclease/phosphatase family protein [Leptolyngbyaceae cyanobacterium M65_K2018_010]|nr:endonuclease/exonuclease/phosphatase family protein [Leptolyngbyaceae cyanobacterium M65_K2018_010]